MEHLLTQEWRVNVDDVIVLNQVAQHASSTVHRCLWRDEIVCMKEIATKNATREISILIKCVHPKICQFLGELYR